MSNSRIPLAVIALLFAAQVTYGQTQGHWRGSQYVGFIPKHLQLQTPEELRRAATTYQSLGNYQPPRQSQPQQEIKQTQFTDAGEILGEEIVDGVASGGDDVVSDAFFAPGVVPVRRGSSPLWGEIELLSWETKGLRTPALATTSDDGTDQDQAGVLPDATVLFGGNQLNDDTRVGGRFRLGMWLDPMQAQTIEFAFTFLEDESTLFSGSAEDGTILARPFLNIDEDREDSRLIVFPDFVDGTLDIDVGTEFHTAEVLLRRRVVASNMTHLAWTLGYRYANLADTIRLRENTTSLSGATEGSTFDLSEVFDTENHFHGGQIGLMLVEAPFACWSVEMGAKFAFGRTHSKTNIAGETTTTDPSGGTATREGGLLALDTNIGQHKDNLSSTISELFIAIRHQFACGVVGSVGYSVLHWSDLGRAGSAIDRVINPTQIPPDTLTGPARPEFQFRTTDFWARGVNFALEYDF